MPRIVPVLTISSWLEQAIAAYGYWAIFVAVSLESLGVAFSDETSLLAGSIYTATTGRVSIRPVIVAADTRSHGAPDAHNSRTAADTATRG